jgi:hypothetical protein
MPLGSKRAQGRLWHRRPLVAEEGRLDVTCVLRMQHTDTHNTLQCTVPMECTHPHV